MSIAILTVLLTCSVGLNVLLRRELQRGRTKPANVPVTGAMVSPLVGQTLDGQPMTIVFERELPTVLYYFSAECGWCERNWPNVEAVRSKVRDRYRFIGVAASANVPAYMRDPTRPLAVVTGLSASARAAFGFSGTPHTVVVGANGRIVDSWLGAWDGTLARSVSAFFEAQIPGLLPRRPRP